MHESSYLITRLFGTDIAFNVPSAIGTVVTCLITYFTVIYFTRNLTLRPSSKRQHLIELLADFVKKIISDNVHWTKYGKRLWTMGLSLIAFIAVANTIGVLIEVKVDNVIYINSITADPTFTFTLAGIMVLFSHYYGYKQKGTSHYFRTYTASGAMLVPFKIIEEFVNLLTLSMRLYGNIYAGEVLIGVLVAFGTYSYIYAVPGIIGLVAWKAFSLFIGLIQAYIFTTMVFIYISHKVSDEH